MTSAQRLAFPFPTANPLEPAPEFARLRADEPVVQVIFPTGHSAWLVTRYEDNRLILSDARFSRSAAAEPGAPRMQPLPPLPGSMISMDPPEHTRLRKLVSRAFTNRRIQSMRPRVEEITDGLLDDLEKDGPPADLVSAVARPLPMQVICELLGVGYEGFPEVSGWVDTIFSLTAGDPAAVRQARGQLMRFIRGLVAAERKEPADDLLSDLIAVRDSGDALSEDELLSLAMTLIAAGFQTTANQITLSCLALLRHPDQLRLLQDGTVPVRDAVEELLRYNALTVSGGLIRIATEDVELGGVLIRAGEAVLPAIGSANRDSAAFAKPDRLDLIRSGNVHITFGHGLHYCLGANLARVELEAVLALLLRRFPLLRLAVAAEDLEWRSDSLFRSLITLPLAW